MPYGDGRHPGIDYLIPVGTPIVAVSDGVVVFTGEPYKDKHWGGGIAVRLKHADDFFSVYAHLSKVYVTIGQHVKRGERLGLSGRAYPKHQELHFGLIKNGKKDSGLYFSETYNPNDFWLSGKPQCFDPNKDYSKYSIKEITFPVECSESR
jgi:murein DD-endopeptidase MepM/ murein hydrolase activator NlpD